MAKPSSKSKSKPNSQSKPNSRSKAGSGSKSKQQPQHEKKTRRNPIGTILLTLLALIMVVFTVLVVQLNLLPDRYVWMMIGAFIVLFLMAHLLLRHFMTSIRCLLGVVFALLLSAVLLGGGYLLSRTQTALDSLTTPEASLPSDSNTDSETDSHEATDKPKDVFTIYISGIDVPGNASTDAQSEINLLATINTSTRQVVLISTPPDFYVQLPNSGEAYDQLINTGIYGIDCSIGALETLYDIEIDYYFRANLNGFRKLIDTLGGITVHSDSTFASSGYQFYEGANPLSGDAALTFALGQNPFSYSDRTQELRRTAVINGLTSKLTAPETLSLYTTLLDTLEGDFETDLPYNLLSELVKGYLDSGDAWNIVRYDVSGQADVRALWSLGTNVNAPVLIPDEKTVTVAKELMRQVCDGTIAKLP